MLPRWMHDVAPAVVVIGVAALWRFAPGPAAAAASIAAVLACLALGAWKAEAGPRAAWLLLAVATALCVLRLIDAWPCDVACQGGGMYRRLLGLDASAWAAIAGAVMTGMAWRRRRAPRAAAADQARLWLLAGVAAYYLILAYRLDLRCGHCFAVHTAFLAAVAVAVRGRLAWRWRLALAALAALALHAVYHHDLLRDRVDAPLVAADEATVARIDHNRRRGSDQAPRVLELGVDLQCPACAELHDRLMAALAGEIDAGRLQVVTRHLARRSEVASGDLVRWALAAAAIDRDQHRLFLAAMLGSRRGANADELERQAQELVDMGRIKRALAEHGAAIDHALALDQQRIDALAPKGRTPIAVLIDRAGDRIITAWDDPIDVADIAKALRPTL